MKYFYVNQSYISIGSNKNNAHHYIIDALSIIKKNKFFLIQKISNTYYTQPADYMFQSKFINIICKFYTFLSVKQILNFFQYIEKKNKKKFMKEKYFSRSLDIDILFFNKKKLYDNQKIFLPHIRMFKRSFIKKILLNT